MKIYHCSPETGEFITETEARESPLEPGVFLIPANATEFRPPIAGEHEVAVFENGAWTVKPDFRGTYYNSNREQVQVAEIGRQIPEGCALEPAPLTPVEILQQQKDAIAEERYNREVSGVEYNGMTIRTDRESQQILDSVSEKIRRGLVINISWKCANGWMELNSANISEIENLVLSHVQSAFAWEKSEVDKL